MDNREKAQELIKVLEKPFSGKFLVELLEAELNRLDTPEPTKWEPRGGKHYVAADNIVKEGASIEPCRLAGREYPKLEEAERAAKLHRKLDRLVNWLVEHCPDICTDDIIIGESGMGSVTVIFDRTENHELTTRISSGEVEL